MTVRILVVDDDVELCGLLRDYLVPEGFTVELAHDGPAGLVAALAGRNGLVVLDVMLPGLGGFEVLRRLRERSAVPVVMLTARGDDADRITGLEAGADDYLPKPFNPRELLARIRAILRRAERPAGGAPESEGLTVGDVELRRSSRTVLRDGEEVTLTGVEFALLDALLSAAGRVLSRDELARKVLGREHSPYDRSIDVHLSSVRRKLGPGVGGGERIKTVRGSGYLYVVGD